jgi:hypothetical protein
MVLVKDKEVRPRGEEVIVRFEAEDEARRFDLAVLASLSDKLVKVCFIP